jgi:PhoPQ-activated pathogenicity-related protein
MVATVPDSIFNLEDALAADIAGTVSVSDGTTTSSRRSATGMSGRTRGSGWNTPTALDRYVAAPDPTYKWHVLETREADGLTITVIEMTSQTWLTPAEVDRPVWTHRMVIARPSNVTSSTALLYIGGGSNKDSRAKQPPKEILALAKASGTVVAELGMVPNQPLVFHNDGVERYEDDLIAYTWDKYMRTGDERWPARLPMTKAAVRALDTITAYCASEAGGSLPVERFVVAGGSKRGWTTWTTAIVDPRVVAICPIVIDVLNIEPSMLHHYQAYGFYSPAVGDYVRHGIMNWMGTPEMTALKRIEDPYEYRHRLGLPKLLLNATGDQFFLPDSAQYYFADLPGVKYLRYVPNTDHSMKDSDAMDTLLAWQYLIANNLPFPRFEWSHDEDGTIRLHTIDKPESIGLWKVTNPLLRDFRLETIGPAWAMMHVMLNETGQYELPVDMPALGWKAYFVEVVYDVGAPTLLKLTTDVRVLPDTVPHDLPTTERPTGFLRQRK